MEESFASDARSTQQQHASLFSRPESEDVTSNLGDSCLANGSHPPDLLHGDIIIDGETEIDDLWVAARIAQLESRKLSEITEPSHRAVVFSRPSLENDDNAVKSGERGRRGRSVTAGLDTGSDTTKTFADFAESDTSSDKGSKDDVAEFESDHSDGNQTNSGFEEGNAQQNQNARAAGRTLEEVDAYLEEIENLERLIVDAKPSERKVKDSKALSDAESESETVYSEDYLEAGQSSQTCDFVDIKKLDVKDLGTCVAQDVKLRLIGNIHAILPELMVIRSSSEQTQPLDLGSVVCLEDRRILGPVSDTFGPVTSPFYVVYSDLLGEKQDESISQDTPVYADESRSSFLLGANGEIPDYLKGDHLRAEGDSDDENSSGDELDYTAEVGGQGRGNLAVAPSNRKRASKAKAAGGNFSVTPKMIPFGSAAEPAEPSSSSAVFHGKKRANKKLQSATKLPKRGVKTEAHGQQNLPASLNNSPDLKHNQRGNFLNFPVSPWIPAAPTGNETSPYVRTALHPPRPQIAPNFLQVPLAAHSPSSSYGFEQNPVINRAGSHSSEFVSPTIPAVLSSHNFTLNPHSQPHNSWQNPDHRRGYTAGPMDFSLQASIQQAATASFPLRAPPPPPWIPPPPPPRW